MNGRGNVHACYLLAQLDLNTTRQNRVIEFAIELSKYREQKLTSSPHATQNRRSDL